VAKSGSKKKNHAARSSSKESAGSGRVLRSASPSESGSRRPNGRKKRSEITITQRTKGSRRRSRSLSRSRSGSAADSVSESAISEKKVAMAKHSTKQKPVRSNYDYRLKYTVHYRNDKAYIGSKSYRKPIQFSESLNKDKKIPVLEEVLELLRSAKSDERGAPGIPYPPRYPYDHSSKPDNSMKYAIFPGDHIRNRRLLIRSPLLLNAIRAVVEFSSEAPSGNLDSMRDGVFPFPYRDLYYHKEDLLKYKQSHPTRARHTDEYNEECDRHIDLLIDFLYTKKEINLKEAEERFDMSQPSTTFGAFWLLMKPGSDVYVFENGRYNAYVVNSCQGGPRFGQEHASAYVVRLWNLVFNGHNIRRGHRTVNVPVFDGDREIKSMPVVPVRFYEEQENARPLRDELIMRGREYLKLCSRPSFMEYTGSGAVTGKLVSENAYT